MPLSPQARSFAKRELEDVRETIYQKDLRPLSAEEHFPVRNDVARWAEYYITRQFEPIGMSGWINDYSQDFPRVGIDVDEDQFRLHSHGCEYGYTNIELERAAANNRNLREQRAMAAQRAIRERNNHVAFFGSASRKLYGLVNYPGVPRVYFDNPINANTAADTIVEEFGAFLDTPNDVTQNNTEVDVVGIPTTQYNFMRRTNVRSGTDTKILEDLRDNIYDGQIDFVKMPELDGAGPDGEDLVVCFEDRSETWGMSIAMPFTQEDPQQEKLAWAVPCHSRTAGVTFDFPLRAAIGILPDA